MYKIKKVASRDEFTKLIEDPKYHADIALTPWGDVLCGGSKPKTWAIAAHSNDCIYVAMRSYESEIRAEEKEAWGKVHLDSCMEFFFSPCPELRCDYFNMEINPLGTMKLDYAAGRHERVHACQDTRIYKINAEIKADYWQLTYEIPYAVISALAPEFKGESGDIIRANFYKCGELAPSPHFIVWNPIDTVRFPNPDFHRPECFGELIFE